jgi:thioredoxin reductase (NADPH)
MPADNTIVMYGTLWCVDCKRAKQFFGEQRVHYDFVDIDRDPDGLAEVERINQGKHVIPTLVFPDGSTLVEPSNAELAQKLGLTTVARCAFYDVLVVGAGPAGLTAALYTAREGLSTLIVERGGVGGQVATTERLDNFPGFPDGITGAEFAERLRRQAERYGVEILSAQEVTRIDVDGAYRVVHTADGHEYRAWAVLLAVGSTYRRLDIPGEDDFIGSGVHFCATCDGPFYRDQELLVIGGGNSAVEESLFLARFASRITIVSRGELSASRTALAKLAEQTSIDVLPGTVPVAFVGQAGHLETVVLRDEASGQQREVHPGGVFVFVGLTANTQLVQGLVKLDERGAIQTDPTLQSSVPGIFAAGDARTGSTKQAASAAGEGAAVALSIRRYVEPLAGGRSAVA